MTEYDAVKIILMRHGKPAIDTGEYFSGSGFGEWLIAYDKAGIDETCPPSVDTNKAALGATYTVCSTLLRSVDSARLLGIEQPDLISELFREAEMPHADWSWPKLPLKVWVSCLRLMQIVGYAKGAESLRVIRERCDQAAEELVRLARKNGTVLLIGHGTQIWFLHRRLVAMGWQGPEKAPRQHWSFGSYCFSGATS